MEQDKSKIMVTWDFSDKSMFALEYAVKLASILKDEVALVHIVKKQNEIQEARRRMADAVQQKFRDSSVVFEFIVRTGTIFHTLGEVAAEIHATPVVMGTHGIVGSQKFLGSWALKVIASSRIPFLVVQTSPPAEILKKIAIPVNFKSETKECVTWANYFNKKFNSKFYLFKAQHTDDNLRKGVDSNLFFLTKYMASKAIPYEVQFSDKDKDFGNETITFARKHDCDAIMVMTTRDIGFADYVLGPQEQYIIANPEQIPVICINPRPAKIKGGFSASGG